VVTDRKGLIVTICDAGLLGATFKQGKLKLEVSERFYAGRLCTIKEAMDALSRADVANLVGKTTVQAAIDESLVDPEAVIYFGEVPHVQIVKL
jgi:hypothetical protein